jgi:hypothetical protein
MVIQGREKESCPATAMEALNGGREGIAPSRYKPWH